MCESRSESGFKAFLAWFEFKPKKCESLKKIEVDLDSSGFRYRVSGFRSGFVLLMSGFAYHWFIRHVQGRQQPCKKGVQTRNRRPQHSHTSVGDIRINVITGFIFFLGVVNFCVRFFQFAPTHPPLDLHKYEKKYVHLGWENDMFIFHSVICTADIFQPTLPP